MWKLESCCASHTSIPIEKLIFLFLLFAFVVGIAKKCNVVKHFQISLECKWFVNITDLFDSLHRKVMFFTDMLYKHLSTN